MIINIDSLIGKISATIASHKLEEGVYTRWLWQNETGTRRLGINEYGCADAANILYTIGEFPGESASREAWVRTLQSLQDPETGLFVEETHHFIHTTAHCTAALELFDAKPKYPMTALAEYATPEGVVGLLESLDWLSEPWDMSHRGAGIYAALKLSDSVDDAWCDVYFDWLWENADPETGFWRKGAVTAGVKPKGHHLAGTFHYLFNHEYARRPLRYPERVIDTCVQMFDDKNVLETFARNVGFMEVDWVYTLSRACRQSGYRHEDYVRVLSAFAEDYIGFLESLDEKTHDGLNDLHALFGAGCCLAELQQALPGMIRSSKPLKLVLDRRPFI